MGCAGSFCDGRGRQGWVDERAPQPAKEGPAAHMEGAREGGGDEDSARTGRAWPGSPPAPALALGMWWKKDGRLPGTMRAVFDLTHGGVACQTRVAVGSLTPTSSAGEPGLGILVTSEGRMSSA